MSKEKIDCFGYREGKCEIMTELICKKSKCSFYKTWNQENKDRKKYGYRLKVVNTR